MRRPRRAGASALRRLVDYLGVTVLAVLALLILERWAPRDSLEGEYAVIDGDSLRHAAGEIRLEGIDAPELGQECRDGDGASYLCGRRARDHLSSLVAGRTVVCALRDVDRYHRRLARCAAEGLDLGREMVAAGWAVPYGDGTLAYDAAEAEARRTRRGLWAGTFDPPKDWRRRHARPRAAAGPDDLPPD
jgi:endonuclease YncB( thermonuclease family)